MTETKKPLLCSYPVPFASNDYRINLYLYNEANYKEILIDSDYYPHIPKNMLAGDPSVLDIEKFSLDMDDEYVICINEDDSTPEERVAALAECLYHAAMEISLRVDSEEFGARVIGDAFKTMATLLDETLRAAELSPVRGLCVSNYPLPLKRENYHITLNMYDESNRFKVVMKLKDEYKAKMLAGKFPTSSGYGFTAMPTSDELGIYINCDLTSTRLDQLTVLAHELFHASKKVTRTFDNSIELGARIYRTLYEQFSKAIVTP